MKVMKAGEVQYHLDVVLATDCEKAIAKAFAKGCEYGMSDNPDQMTNGKEYTKRVMEE